MMAYLEVEQQGLVQVWTISREKVLNALNDEVIAALAAAMDAVDPAATRCVVVTGKGAKAFVAGADIGDMATRSRKDAKNETAPGSDTLRRLETLAVPTIAAINGYALGGGCELALCCDIRVASDNAVLGLPEVTLGIIPGYGGTQRLPRLIGPAKAKELIFTARRVKAEEALALGLVNQVVPQAQLMETCLEMAQRIAQNAPIGVRAAKQAVNRGLQTDMENGLAIELELCANCFETEDQQNAMRAFVEKQKPPPFVNR